MPNGLKFLQPETGWSAPAFASFDTIVRGLISHRMGNPFLVQKYKWSTDYNNVANEVDYYNAMLCKQMGWNAFFVSDEGSTPPPKLNTPSLAPRLRAVAGGAQLHLEWYGQGNQTVPQDKANARASVCSQCPKNKKADLGDFFTVKAAAIIQRQIEKRREMKLETRFDDQLGICDACLCPMKLKVWTPLALILKHLQPELKAALHHGCWVLAEERDAKR